MKKTVKPRTYSPGNYWRLVIQPESRDHWKSSPMSPKPRRWIVGITITGNFLPSLLMHSLSVVGISRVRKARLRPQKITQFCLQRFHSALGRGPF